MDQWRQTIKLYRRLAYEQFWEELPHLSLFMFYLLITSVMPLFQWYHELVGLRLTLSVYCPLTLLQLRNLYTKDLNRTRVIIWRYACKPWRLIKSELFHPWTVPTQWSKIQRASYSCLKQHLILYFVILIHDEQPSLTLNTYLNRVLSQRLQDQALHLTFWILFQSIPQKLIFSYSVHPNGFIKLKDYMTSQQGKATRTYSLVCVI